MAKRKEKLHQKTLRKIIEFSIELTLAWPVDRLIIDCNYEPMNYCIRVTCFCSLSRCRVKWSEKKFVIRRAFFPSVSLLIGVRISICFANGKMKQQRRKNICFFYIYLFYAMTLIIVSIVWRRNAVVSSFCSFCCGIFSFSWRCCGDLVSSLVVIVFEPVKLAHTQNSTTTKITTNRWDEIINNIDNHLYFFAPFVPYFSHHLQ